VAESTVGNAASGATYAADVGALQLWEDAIDGGTPGDYEAKIITDIQDDVIFDIFGTGTWNLQIYGDTQGPGRRVLSAPASGTWLFRFNDTDINTVLIRDLNMDGTNQIANRYAIWAAGAPVDSLTVRRVFIKNTSNIAVHVQTGPATTVLENVLVHNSGATGFTLGPSAAATTTTVRNCGAYKSTTYGFTCADSSNVTVTYWNCVAVGSDITDFRTRASANVHLHECVSEDTSANTGHDTMDNCVSSQTNLSAYFVDYTNDDFHLAQPDFTSWGINGDATETPVDDLDFRTRLNNDIGPYEYVLVNTRQKRFSMMNFGDGTHIHTTFEADGAVNLDDRQHLLDCYSGVAFFSTAPATSIPVLMYHYQHHLGTMN
jgi:hypothetical protein